MCLSKPKMPEPKAAPPAPSPATNPNLESMAVAEAERRRKQRAGSRQSTIIARLSDSEANAAGTTKRLLGE